MRLLGYLVNETLENSLTNIDKLGFNSSRLGKEGRTIDISSKSYPHNNDKVG